VTLSAPVTGVEGEPKEGEATGWHGHFSGRKRRHRDSQFHGPRGQSAKRGGREGSDAASARGER
jgi:hypothetical protein